MTYIGTCLNTDITIRTGETSGLPVTQPEPAGVVTGSNQSKGK